jgi:hypothetical protein
MSNVTLIIGVFNEEYTTENKNVCILLVEGMYFMNFKKVTSMMILASSVVVGSQFLKPSNAAAEDVWAYAAGVSQYYVMTETVAWDHTHGVLTCKVKQVENNRWIGSDSYRFLHDSGTYYVKNRMSGAKNVYDDTEVTNVYNIAKDVSGYY